MTRIHSSFAAFALVVVMAVGLWQVTAALARIDYAQIPASIEDFREGRTTGKLQNRLEQALPGRDAMIAAANTLRFVLLGAASEEVRVGSEGWLFLADELRFSPESPRAMRSRLDFLAEADASLKRRNILLVVALVPDKARVYGRYLRAADIPPEHRARYSQALAQLRARGVAVVDLLAPLAEAAREGEVYYRTDTHWNPRGAQLAAGAVAKSVRDRGARLPSTRFRSTAGAETERAGDLIRLMGLEHAPRALRPRPDRERPVTTEEISEGQGAALLGEFRIPAVLLGTSYSMRANFHGFLQEALGARVLNASRDGAGFLQSAREYFGNEAFRSDPPQVVIWEVPERVLSEPSSADPPSAGILAPLRD